MNNRSYGLDLYDTSSPDAYVLLKPDYILLCYDIGDRRSLTNIQTFWWPKMIEWFMKSRDDIPVMLLGLKRDLRSEEPEADTISPLEGHRVSAELRCEQYAECSTLTGELVKEVIEDVVRKAATITSSNSKMGEMKCTIT